MMLMADEGRQCALESGRPASEDSTRVMRNKSICPPGYRPRRYQEYQQGDCTDDYSTYWLLRDVGTEKC